jgi:general secretion pathway protein B
MSYILDALRKSDQQRQRGAAPTLVTGQAAPAAPKPSALFSYGLLALILLGAGIAIGWLRPWEPGPAATAPVAVAAKPSEAGQSQAPVVRPEMAPKPEPKPEAQAQNSAPAARAVPAPAPALAQPRGAAGARSERKSARPKAVAAAPKEAAVPVPVPEQPPGGAAANVAPAQNVISIA